MASKENELEIEEIQLHQKRFGFSLNPLFLNFVLIIFFIYLADALMSYSAPDYLEKNLGNSAIMGIVLSSSSFVGIFAGAIIGEFFKKKRYTFFLKSLFIFALAFPLSLMLMPAAPLWLIFAMAMWGVYYEFISFANAKFIEKKTAREKHAFNWSILLTFKSLGYALGPIIASSFGQNDERNSFGGALFFFLAAMIGFIFLITFLDRNRKSHKPIQLHLDIEKKVEKNGLGHELKSWAILMKVLWPVLIFFFITILVDSFFWTVGVLLSEDLKSQGIPGGLLITLYMLPSLFIVPLVAKIPMKFGKKRTALILYIISAILLSLVFFTERAEIILLIVFISSFFFALSQPLLSGTLSDYIGRLGEHSNHLIALQNFWTDFAYVVGPIVAGLVADQFGNKNSFFVIGIFAAIVAFICLIFVPRKIKMPQNELSKV